MLAPPPHPRARVQYHAAALQRSLEQDYPVAQVDSWPLTSRASYKRPFAGHQTPPLSPAKSSDPAAAHTRPPDVVGDTFSSPVSPRQRKAAERHSLVDESKTKPLLLQELQAFVDAELRGLAQQQQQQTHVRSCLQRLQVFRHVFQRVIAAFSVYAPVLAQVQDEYERAISQLRAQSLQVPTLHAQLQTLQSHCVQEIAAHNLETKLRSQALKKQLKHTQGRLTALAAQNAALQEANAALQAQVETLGQRSAEMQLSNLSLVNGIKRHDDTLRHIHERSREEGLALAQMTSKYHHACEEIAELKRTIATLEEKVGGVHVAADKATIALLTRDLQDTHARLQGALKSSSVVALDTLQHELGRQRALGSAFVRVLDAQGVRVTVLELLSVMDRSLCDDQSSAAALAGDGAACSEATVAAVEALAAYVLEKLEPLAQPKLPSTATTFLTETEELRSVDVAGHMLSTTDLLVGRGCGADVPEFLQFDGVVRNLRYPRRKLEQILTRVWQQKDELEKIKRSHHGGGGRPSLGGAPSASAQQVPLAKAFSMLLSRTTSSRFDAVESAYNVLAALERFAPHSSDCHLFLEILRGEVSEEARQDQLKELYVVHDALAALEKDRSTSSSSGDPALPGRVPLAAVVQLLRQVFPWKSERALSALHHSLLLDQRGSAQVDYAALLLQQQPQEDARARAGGGGRSHFAECLRSQYIDDLVAYRRHLQAHIERKLLGPPTERDVTALPPSGSQAEAAPADPLSATHGVMVSVRDLRELLQECDPAKPVQEINRVLATASGLSLDQVLTQDALVVNAQQFLRKLPTLLVKPTGKFAAG